MFLFLFPMAPQFGEWISLGVQVVILKFQNSMNEDPKRQEGDSMRQETFGCFASFIGAGVLLW